MLPPILHHDGLVLRLLTSDVTARLPDLDPARRDAIAATSGGWIDFEGNRQPAQLISHVFRPGDVLYYWDGPFGFLSGSRGIAIVRRGTVVASFPTLVS